MSFKEFTNQIIKNYCYFADKEFLHITGAAMEVLFNCFSKSDKLSPVFCFNSDNLYIDMKVVAFDSFEKTSRCVSSFIIKDGCLLVFDSDSI